MKIREYIGDPNLAEGKDEGGYFRYIEVPDLTPQIQNRIFKCVGCYNRFYNYRANINSNYCWNLDRDENFKSKGKPSCYR